MPGKDSLASLGEFGFLRRLLPRLKQRRGVILGPGDDCAVVRAPGNVLLTTDVLVEGVHFEPGWLTPAQIGAKAVLVNLSDVAAMGGRPRFLLLSVGVPRSLGRRDLDRLHRGADAAARAAGASIVGGNLSGAERLFVSVALVGEARRPVARAGAKAGDLLFVTGTLGDAAAAVELHETFPGGRLAAEGRRRGDIAFLLRRFAAPTPRLRTGRLLAEAGLVSSMIDVSDGLVQDLGHLCRASGTGAVIAEDEVPRSPAYERVIGGDATLALRGGEDYELLFTVPRRSLAAFERRRRRLPDPVRCIGEIVPGRGVRLRDRSGRLRRPESGGFEHFKVA